VKLDPLTGAACTLEEIHEMTEELIAANDEHIPDLTWPDGRSRGPSGRAGE
jgi:alpha-galactosidase